jgi:hypothetical protein
MGVRTVMLDEVAFAHEHRVHAQPGGHMLNEMLCQHGGLDLSRPTHGGVGRAICLAQVQIEVEFGEGIRLQT